MTKIDEIVERELRLAQKRGRDGANMGEAPIHYDHAVTACRAVARAVVEECLKVCNGHGRWIVAEKIRALAAPPPGGGKE